MMLSYSLFVISFSLFAACLFLPGDAPESDCAPAQQARVW
jgi:hypothetical protein